jgi:hypothetical protein
MVYRIIKETESTKEVLMYNNQEWVFTDKTLVDSIVKALNAVTFGCKYYVQK